MPKDEMNSILNHCHTLPCGGHFGGQRTVAKVLQSGFYWLTLFKDAHQFVSTCDKCQRRGGGGGGGGVAEVTYPEKGTFTVNTQRLKPYFEGKFHADKQTIPLTASYEVQ